MEEWRKLSEERRQERRRLNRRAKLGLTKNNHACGVNCSHQSPNTSKAANPQKSPVTTEPESWFEKYAELSLVEMGAGIPEVNAVPKTDSDGDFEIISVTVDSGAYNTVGPP